MAIASDLTVQQLQCFVAIAEEEQFTRAADRLHLAQPSVSFQIRRMETVLGTRLFDRGRAAAQLTDAGQALLPIARRVLGDLADMVVQVDDLKGLRSGHVAIGATPSLATALLPQVLARFHRRYPGITLAVTERDSDQLAEALEAGTIDVALTTFPLRRRDLEHVPLAVEELVVVVEPSHRLAEREEVRIIDLRDVPLIMFHEGYDLRAVTLRAFDAAGVAPLVALEGAEIGSVLSLVASGLGAAIVPSVVVANAPSVRVLRVAKPRLERQIGLLRRRDRPLTLAASALCDELHAQLAEHGWPGASPGDALLG